MSDDPPETTDGDLQVPDLDPGREADAALSSDKDQATQEALGFSQQNLEERSQANEHRRTETLRNHAHWAVIFTMWVGWVAFMLAAVTVVWHLLAPERWEWLTVPQQNVLTAIVTSGLGTGLFGRYLARRVPS